MACFSYLIAWLLPSWQASYSIFLHAPFMERMLSIFFWFLSLIACVLLEIYMVPTRVLTTVPVAPPRPATRTCGGPICMHTPQNLLVPTGTHAPLPSSRRSPPAALARLMRPLVPRYERAPSANQRHMPRASPRAQQMDTAALPRKCIPNQHHAATAQGRLALVCRERLQSPCFAGPVQGPWARGW